MFQENSKEALMLEVSQMLDPLIIQSLLFSGGTTCVWLSIC